MSAEILLAVIALELAIIAALAFKILRTLTDARDAIDSLQQLNHDRSLAIIDGIEKLIKQNPAAQP